jgi:hypothetical protein
MSAPPPIERPVTVGDGGVFVGADGDLLPHPDNASETRTTPTR